MPGDSVKQASDTTRMASSPSLEIVLPHRTTPALLLSLALHVILLTTIGLIWSQSPRGTGEQADRPVGIAMVHRLPDRDRYVDVAKVDQPDPHETEDTDPTSASSAAAAPRPICRHRLI